MTPQRVSLITLGSGDLDRSRKFYSALGWEPVPSPPEVVFYQLDGMVLGLFGLKPLAKDQGRPEPSTVNRQRCIPIVRGIRGGAALQRVQFTLQAIDLLLCVSWDVAHGI